MEVERRAKSEGEERNHHSRAMGEEFTKVRIQIAEKHAKRQRKDRAYKRLPKKA